MAGVWQVVHKPRVAVRSEASTSGQIVGALRTGAEVRPVQALGAWLRLEGDPSGWVLSDGASVGLGALLQRLDDQPIRLLVKHPTSPTLVLLELELPGCSLVGEARAALERAGLEPSAALPCKKGSFADVVPDSTTLYDAGFRDGDDFTFAYSGALPGEGGGGARGHHERQPLALRRLREGQGTAADIREAVAGSWQAEALTAMLEQAGSGSSLQLALLFAWGLSPQLGAVRVHEPEEGDAAKGTVLVLGWGGSTAEQLEAPRRWWQQRGWRTAVTTRGAFDVEAQVAAIMGALPESGPVLVHAFSNNGLYMLCDLQAHLGHRVLGVIVDSAPDTALSETLLRQVANGCIRALCAAHQVSITDAADQALTSMEVSDLVDGPANFPDLSLALRTPMVVEAGHDDEVGRILPSLFIYSKADTLIKPAAVEAYASEYGGADARALCVEGSQHVRHFERHRARYGEAVTRFVESLGLSLRHPGP